MQCLVGTRRSAWGKEAAGAGDEAGEQCASGAGFESIDLVCHLIPWRILAAEQESTDGGDEADISLTIEEGIV